jgi:hypothetical protein
VNPANGLKSISAKLVVKRMKEWTFLIGPKLGVSRLLRGLPIGRHIGLDADRNFDV